MTELWLTFLAGAAGSVHCLGMCGAIVAAVASVRPRLTGTATFQLLYNLGRICAYALLGLLAGVAGAALDLVALKTATFWILGAANAMVMLIGLSSMLAGGRFSPATFIPDSAGLLAAGIRRLLNGDSPLRALPLGFLLGFLPCGLVYAPLLAAGASASPLRGGATMAALGLGTMPALLGAGWLAGTVSTRLRGIFTRVAGLLVAMVGFVGLWRTLGKMGHTPPFPLW